MQNYKVLSKIRAGLDSNTPDIGVEYIIPDKELISMFHSGDGMEMALIKTKQWLDSLKEHNINPPGIDYVIGNIESSLRTWPH